MAGMTFGYKDKDWDQEEGARVINAALQAGVTHLDTSDIYGPHTNEVLVGTPADGQGSLFQSSPCSLPVSRGTAIHCCACLTAPCSAMLNTGCFRALYPVLSWPGCQSLPGTVCPVCLGHHRTQGSMRQHVL